MPAVTYRIYIAKLLTIPVIFQLKCVSKLKEEYKVDIID
jgi:hypothetical protein